MNHDGNGNIGKRVFASLLYSLTLFILDNMCNRWNKVIWLYCFAYFYFCKNTHTAHNLILFLFEYYTLYYFKMCLMLDCFFFFFLLRNVTVRTPAFRYLDSHADWLMSLPWLFGGWLSQYFGPSVTVSLIGGKYCSKYPLTSADTLLISLTVTWQWTKQVRVSLVYLSLAKVMIFNLMISRHDRVD